MGSSGLAEAGNCRHQDHAMRQEVTVPSCATSRAHSCPVTGVTGSGCYSVEMRSVLGCLMSCVALGGIRLAAQSPVTAGVTVGTVKLSNARSEQALTGVVRYQATPWLGLSAMPGTVHVTDVINGRSVSSSGFGDLPLSADAFHAFATPGSPVVAAALTGGLPAGGTAWGGLAGGSRAALPLGRRGGPAAA